MTQLTDIIKKEFTEYRQSQILWNVIKENVVDVRIPYYDASENEVDFGEVFETDNLPVATLKISERLSKAKRKEVTSKTMYFYNNSMYKFCREYGVRK